MLNAKSMSRLAGTTLIETLVAATLVAGFFVSIFAVNAVCLHYINASKEGVGAIQGVQDRLEQLRNLDFPSLTNTSSMTTLLTTPSDTSPIASNVTETVKLTDYSNTSTNVTYTRTPGASVTPTSAPSNPNFSNTTLLQIDVTYLWSAALGGRTRTAQASTIVSAGTKK